MEDDDIRVRRLLVEFARRVRPADSGQQLDATAAEVMGGFDDAGVGSVLLKGPVLARLLYEPEEERHYADIDILIEPAALERARRVLHESGYLSINERLGIRDVGGALHSEPWLAGEVMIDLHWRLAGAEAPAQAAWEALSATRTPIDVAGRRVAGLGRPALALHIATHAAQHGSSHTPGLRDLELALERWSPQVWTDAAEMASAIGATRAFAAGLQVVAAGRALARDLGLPDRTELDWVAVHDSGRPRGTFHLKEFAEAGSLAARVDLLRRAVLPPRRWIIWQHPWARRGAPLLIVAYAAHVMRAPLWAARAWRFSRRAGRSV